LQNPFGSASLPITLSNNQTVVSKDEKSIHTPMDVHDWSGTPGAIPIRHYLRFKIF
jgi:hypothetical protein